MNISEMKEKIKAIIDALKEMVVAGDLTAGQAEIIAPQIIKSAFDKESIEV